MRSLWLHRYTGMVSRCTDPGHAAWHNYGGRGIRVHAAWLADRREFFRYAKSIAGWDRLGLDLDRIDNDGHYEPGNLRLVPRALNSRNRRNALLLRYDGRDYHVSEFHREVCPRWNSVNTIRYHLDQGRSPEQIVAIYRAGAGLRPS